jgi:hypothetical protein
MTPPGSSPAGPAACGKLWPGVRLSQLRGRPQPGGGGWCHVPVSVARARVHSTAAAHRSATGSHDAHAPSHPHIRARHTHPSVICGARTHTSKRDMCELWCVRGVYVRACVRRFVRTCVRLSAGRCACSPRRHRNGARTRVINSSKCCSYRAVDHSSKFKRRMRRRARHKRHGRRQQCA